MKKYCLLIWIAIAFSCTNTQETNESQLLHVVATTGMLYDALINIGGDKITTDVIMGPGVDPHLYKATQGDLKKLNRANLVIYNGILLEGKMSEILEKLGRQKPTVPVAESIPDTMFIKHAGYDDALDPHVWFDVKRWSYAVEEIYRALAELDSVNSQYYRNNYVFYQSKLDSFDQYVKSRLNEIPSSQRILVTAHDAFGYFGDAYNIRVEAVQGMSTVSDFGLKDIADLIDLIIENKIKAIFVETSVSEKSINAVIEGCRAKGHEVLIGGYLYSDAMGEIGTEEGTYIGMFKKNVETIVDALK